MFHQVRYAGVFEGIFEGLINVFGTEVF